MSRWISSWSCTGCDGGHSRHLLRAGALRTLRYAVRAAARGYPVRHRCGGDLYDVRVTRAQGA